MHALAVKALNAHDVRQLVGDTGRQQNFPRSSRALTGQAHLEMIRLARDIDDRIVEQRHTRISPQLLPGGAQQLSRRHAIPA